jgi:sirohydrochlorin ferrochelatase
VTTGYVVFAHGSRIEAANEAVRAAAAGLARAGGFDLVRAAFLELGQPDLAGAVGQLTAAGVERVVVIPYFLTLGLHMERDLPALLQDISHQYNGLTLALTSPLDGHPGLVQALLDRARGAGEAQHT